MSTQYHIYATTEKAWEGMLAAIRSATKSIYVQMYIFERDTPGYDFFDELEQSAKRGVKVILILDIFGSYSVNYETTERLRNAGVEVIFYSFFFQRLHRKVLIVDERKTFVGGVNIGGYYAGWKDLQIGIEGDKVIRPIMKSFARIYHECGGKDKLVTKWAREGVITKAKLWFVEHGIGKKRYALHAYYKERFRHAKKSIIIVTPYLAPPRWLMAELHQAVVRGVNVQIIMPESSDPRFTNRINRIFASFATTIGIHAYFIPGMNHAKAMLIDDREGAIGSQNFDFLSLNWMAEAGVFFHEPEMVRDLAFIINEWKKESVLFDPERKKMSLLDKIVSFFLRIFGFLPFYRY